jgi:hypothetical protein
MAQIVVPQAMAEDLGGERKTQAAGAWQGTIDEVRIREFPDWVDPVASPKGGYANSTGEILSIELGSQEPLEGQEDVGGSKLFVDFVVRDGDLEIEDVDVTVRDVPHWQLQSSARRMANLAIALGATEELEDEDGKVNTVVAEDFRYSLMNGAIKGTKVGYVLSHRNWTSKKSGKSGTEVRTQTFQPAV